MKHEEISNPRLKARCLRGIATSNITQAQGALLACFVETYLPLTQAEQEAFEQLIQREEVTVVEFITSWERKGREQGRAEGIEIGRERGSEQGVEQGVANVRCPHCMDDWFCILLYLLYG
jgi:flagellar biosynthesis/type III secretory pathway protein FliH